MHGIDDVEQGKIIELVGQNCTCGHSLKLVKHRTKSQIRRCVLCHRVVNDWKNLPECVVTAKIVNQFTS